MHLWNKIKYLYIYVETRLSAIFTHWLDVGAWKGQKYSQSENIDSYPHAMGDLTSLFKTANFFYYLSLYIQT